MTTDPKCHRCGKPCGHAYADYGDETRCLDCDAALADLSWRYDDAGPLDDCDDGEGVALAPSLPVPPTTPVMTWMCRADVVGK
jgi:hypothetical protein